VTAAEAVAAVQSQLGHRVKVSIEEGGRTRRTCQGILKPGLDSATEAIPDEEGSVTFKVGDYAWWFRLNPSVVTDAQEHAGRRQLRVHMGAYAVVIESLERAT
jgi:hypothetical protein